MKDDLSSYYAEFLDGTYDCVDRIVLNACTACAIPPAVFESGGALSLVLTRTLITHI